MKWEAGTSWICESLALTESLLEHELCHGRPLLCEVVYFQQPSLTVPLCRPPHFARLLYRLDPDRLGVHLPPSMWDPYMYWYALPSCTLSHSCFIVGIESDMALTLYRVLTVLPFMIYVAQHTCVNLFRRSS